MKSFIKIIARVYNYHRITGIFCLLFISAYSQSLVLTSPSGGENWTCGSTETITWTGTGISASVQMSLSNDGTSWRYVEYSTNDGSEPWPVPYLSQTTSTVRLQVYEADVGSPLSDTSGAFTLTLSTPDPCEPNEDSTNGYVLSPGDTLYATYIHFVFKAGDVSDNDWYRFSGSENERVLFRFYLTSESGIYCDMQCGVYDTDKNLLKQEWFGSSDEMDSLVLNLPSDGTYYLLVRGGSWTDFGRYSLKYIKSSPATLTLSAPAGGENWECGSTETITWSSSGINESVQMSISKDGATWRYVEYSTDDGSESWPIPYLSNTMSTIQMRIYESDAGWPVSDTSDAFTLTVSTPDPCEPNDDSTSGYVLSPGDSLYTTYIYLAFKSTDVLDNDWYTFTGNIGDRVTLRIYPNPATGTLNNLQGGVYDTDKNLLQEEWISSSQQKDSLVLNLPTDGTYYLWIRGSDWSDCGRYSLKYKKESPGVLTLSSPTGGENWDCGSTQTITWSGSGISEDVQMSISPDGTTWRYVEYSTNDGSEPWPVPYLNQTISSILMQVYESDVTSPVSDTSDAFTLTLSTPDPCEPNEDSTSGYVLNPGDSLYTTFIHFAFKASDVLDNDWYRFSGNEGDRVLFRLYLTQITGFSHYLRFGVYDTDKSLLKEEWISSSDEMDSLVLNLPSTGTYYLWLRGDHWSDHGRYSLVYINNSSPPSLTVTSPDGGETLITGTSHDITWNHGGTVGNVKIEYSTNNGSSWTEVVSSTDNDGIHPWSIPDVNSTNCKIKISEAFDEDPVDESDAVFTIAAAPSITVISPNGGDTLITGTSHDIIWTHTGTVGDVKIEFSTNGGSDWNSIENTTPNNGTYPWTVPSAASANCKVRISEASDDDPSDESDAVFTIETAPSITVTAPNGGETWFIDSSYTIIWTTTGTVGNVKIEYSTNGGSDWTELIASTANSGTHPWTVQTTASVNGKIKISEASDGFPVDESDAVFTIEHITSVDEHPESPLSGTGFRASPNPVITGKKIAFYFSTVRDVVSADLKVYDPVGNLVFRSGTLNLKGISKKRQYTRVPWDLRNMSGKAVAGGTYLAILLIRASDGKTDAVKTIIGIKDK